MYIIHLTTTLPWNGCKGLAQSTHPHNFSYCVMVHVHYIENEGDFALESEAAVVYISCKLLHTYTQ